MILAVFVVIAAIGQLLNVALCLAIDQLVSPTVGALSFVLLYMFVFAAAWLIALRIVERRQPAAQSTEPRAITQIG